MKYKIICGNRGRIETCMDADTQAKFNSSSTILGDILRNHRSLEDKIGLWYKGSHDNICDNEGWSIPEGQDAS